MGIRQHARLDFGVVNKGIRNSADQVPAKGAANHNPLTEIIGEPLTNFCDILWYRVTSWRECGKDMRTASEELATPGWKIQEAHPTQCIYQTAKGDRTRHLDIGMVKCARWKLMKGCGRKS